MASGASSKKKASKQGIFEKWTIDSEVPVKIDKWDGNAVKNSLDDAAKKVLTDGFGYKEDHTVVDTRLAICTVSCLFAVAALLYDYLHPFPASRYVLMICVISYFILMSVLTLFMTFKEKNYIMFAIQKDSAGVGPDHHWTLQSALKRYDHFYELVLAFNDGETHKHRQAALKKSVASWFDENGVLLFDLFEKDFRELHSTLISEKKDK